MERRVILSPTGCLSHSLTLCINTWHYETRAAEERSYFLIYQSILQGWLDGFNQKKTRKQLGEITSSFTPV